MQFELLEAMVREGNQSSISDAGVGAVLALAAVEGGWMNVMINLPGLKDRQRAAGIQREADAILEFAKAKKQELQDLVLHSLIKS